MLICGVARSARSNLVPPDFRASYIKDISKYPLLKKDEEIAVLLRIQAGDQRAIHKLVCANLKFVINVAFMYKNQGFCFLSLPFSYKIAFL